MQVRGAVAAAVALGRVAGVAAKDKTGKDKVRKTKRQQQKLVLAVNQIKSSAVNNSNNHCTTTTDSPIPIAMAINVDAASTPLSA